MQEAAGGGTEQFIVTVTDDKSDKTPAEIAEAVKAGKQVVLQRISGPDSIETGFLVSIVNDIASFCLIDQLTEGTADTDPIFTRNWISIAIDQTAEEVTDLNVPFFAISKDGSGKYTSTLNPGWLASALGLGCAANALFTNEDGVFNGTFVKEGDTTHLYFPDYAKGKIYDFKWNGDENPSTYTFTELSFGKELLIVTFSPGGDGGLTADKTYEEVYAAYKQNTPIYGAWNLGMSEVFLQCSSYNKDGNEEFLKFFGAGPNGTYLAVSYVKGNDQGEIFYEIGFGILDFLSSDRDAPGFDAKNIKIYNLPNPTENADAATKGYADKILIAGNSDSVVIKSSTPNSTKKFSITVNDAGAITATEVV